MQVIERRYQECPGGVQLHYLLRRASKFETQYVVYNEIEVIPFIKDNYEADEFFRQWRIKKKKDTSVPNEGIAEAVWEVEMPEDPQQQS